jgi:hypothetical protein
MKNEIKWIIIWILAITALTMLELTYIYLNNELMYYLKDSMILFFIATAIPYAIWKYDQMKNIANRNIEILFIPQHNR